MPTLAVPRRPRRSLAQLHEAAARRRSRTAWRWARRRTVDRLQDFCTKWAAAIIFMGAIVYVLWRTLKLMPQTKPQQIKPHATQEIGWEDIAGVEEAKHELREVVDFLRDPRRFKRARREGAERRPAPRPARHRQDAAGQGGRPRVRRAVLLAVGVLVRRDVRRPRRRADPAPVRRGAQARAGDHLHRRARRRRRAPRHGQQLRARADAQPAPRRDGRLLLEQPTSSSWRRRTCSRSSTRRCCAPAASTARSSSRRPTSAAASEILEVHTRTKPLRDDVDLGPRRAADQRPDRGRPGQHLQRGGDLLRPARRPRDRAGDFDDALERVIAGVQSSTTLNDHERRVVAYHEAGHALCRELLRRSTASTRSRSSPAAARSAT